MKDNFSHSAAAYARSRPGYPDSVLNFILEHTRGRDAAWDCGTGNGQIARKLKPYFESVYATDISLQQIREAHAVPGISYNVEAAEACSAPDRYFNLIVVAQAIHWFDFDRFYAQVYRTLKQDGTFVALGYDLVQVDEAVDKLLQELYVDILGSYWDPERHHIDEHYRSIPFPFREIPNPGFEMRYDWNLEQFTGYLLTWSALRHYQAKHQANALDVILPRLQEVWPAETSKTIYFPLFVRLGKILPDSSIH